MLYWVVSKTLLHLLVKYSGMKLDVVFCIGFRRSENQYLWILFIWYICRHLNKCCVVKLNWPNLGIWVLLEMSYFIWKHFFHLIFTQTYLPFLENIFSKSADKIMCVTLLIKIRPCRQIQINGYCYYQKDLEAFLFVQKIRKILL